MPYKTFGTEVLTSSDVNAYLMRQSVIICTSATRPTSPVSGMHIWETDTQKGYVYDGGWRFKEAPVSSMFVRKTADEFVTNSSTLQNDDQLFVTVPPSTRWWVELFIVYNSPTAADFRFSFSPDVYNWGAYGPYVGETAKDSALTDFRAFTTPNPIAGFGSDSCWRVRGMMPANTSAAPQTVAFRWAQGTANAVGTVVRAGSYMYLKLVDG